MENVACVSTFLTLYSIHLHTVLVGVGNNMHSVSDQSDIQLLSDTLLSTSYNKSLL